MITIFSLLAAGLTVAGALIITRLGSVSRTLLSRTLAVSSGILVSVAFMDIFPAGWSVSGTAVSYGALAALLALFMAEAFSAMHSCSEYLEECMLHSIGWAAFAAIFLHSLLDGFNITMGFSTGSMTGINVSLGVVLHKLADGMTLASILLQSGRSKRHILILSLTLAAATPLGSAVMAPLTEKIGPDAISFCLGLSGGSFLYIAMADILPRLHKSSDRAIPLLYPLGYAAVWLMHFLGD